MVNIFLVLSYEKKNVLKQYVNWFPLVLEKFLEDYSIVDTNIYTVTGKVDNVSDEENKILWETTQLQDLITAKMNGDLKDGDYIIYTNSDNIIINNMSALYKDIKQYAIVLHPHRVETNYFDNLESLYFLDKNHCDGFRNLNSLSTASYISKNRNNNKEVFKFLGLPFEFISTCINQNVKNKIYYYGDIKIFENLTNIAPDLNISLFEGNFSDALIFINQSNDRIMTLESVYNNTYCICPKNISTYENINHVENNSIFDDFFISEFLYDDIITKVQQILDGNYQTLLNMQRVSFSNFICSDFIFADMFSDIIDKTKILGNNDVDTIIEDKNNEQRD